MDVKRKNSITIQFDGDSLVIKPLSLWSIAELQEEYGPDCMNPADLSGIQTIIGIKNFGLKFLISLITNAIEPSLPEIASMDNAGKCAFVAKRIQFEDLEDLLKNLITTTSKEKKTTPEVL